MKKILIVSVVFNLALLFVCGAVLWKTGGVNYVMAKVMQQTPKYDDNIYYQERKSLFDELIIPENSTVFIGDSLTQKSEWNEFFSGQNIIDRGVGSDTTEGVLSRLDSIVESKPKKVFIMIGVNDLSYNFDIKDIKENYSEIIKRIKTTSADTEIFIQSVLPVNNDMYGNVIDNEQVIKLNKELEKLANDYKAEYIDVYSAVSKNKELPSNLTIDGIHLNGDGYKLWSEAIEEYVLR